MNRIEIGVGKIISELIEDNYIKRERIAGKDYYVLTPEGERQIALYSFNSSLRHSPSWEGNVRKEAKLIFPLK